MGGQGRWGGLWAAARPPREPPQLRWQSLCSNVMGRASAKTGTGSAGFYFSVTECHRASGSRPASVTFGGRSARGAGRGRGVWSALVPDPGGGGGRAAREPREGPLDEAAGGRARRRSARGGKCGPRPGTRCCCRPGPRQSRPPRPPADGGKQKQKGIYTPPAPAPAPRSRPARAPLAPRSRPARSRLRGSAPGSRARGDRGTAVGGPLPATPALRPQRARHVAAGGLVNLSPRAQGRASPAPRSRDRTTGPRAAERKLQTTAYSRDCHG
jgi:hypothetical protein